MKKLFISLSVIIGISFIIIGPLSYFCSLIVKETDENHNIINTKDHIEIFEYSGHEYLRYKVGNNNFGGICHKQDCKYCQ